MVQAGKPIPYDVRTPAGADVTKPIGAIPIYLYGNVGIGEDGQIIQGPAGPQGPKGDKGDKGDRGDAGPMGAPGVRGPAGVQGERGPQGEQGLRGPAGDVTGVVGPQGEIGPQGPQGVPGATGDKGDKGDKGDPGDAGPKGDTGDRGETGPQGPQGIQGVPGSDGAQGERGLTGDTGPRGEAGPRGEQGIQGPQGPKGDTGATGAVGPKGDQGERGPAGNGVAEGGLAGQVLVMGGSAPVWGRQRVSFSGTTSRASFASVDVGTFRVEFRVTEGNQTFMLLRSRSGSKIVNSGASTAVVGETSLHVRTYRRQTVSTTTSINVSGNSTYSTFIFSDTTTGETWRGETMAPFPGAGTAATEVYAVFDRIA